MEVTGKIKRIEETKTFGTSGFRSRKIVVLTSEQYPQPLEVEFVQDKVDLLNPFKVDEDVKISINLRGREWINPQGEAVYFNSIQGWRIEKADITENVPEYKVDAVELGENEPDDLPF